MTTTLDVYDVDVRCSEGSHREAEETDDVLRLVFYRLLIGEFPLLRGLAPRSRSSSRGVRVGAGKGRVRSQANPYGAFPCGRRTSQAAEPYRIARAVSWSVIEAMTRRTIMPPPQPKT